jgi:peptidoglycan lytic transglycosylase
VQVTNLENGREAILRINDRGPFKRDRLIDVSQAAAQVLGFESAGRARVNVRYLGPAPRHVLSENVAPPSAPPAQPAAQSAARLGQPASAPIESGPLSLLPPGAQAASATAAPAPAFVAPASGYAVQLGAFADEANAERLRAALAGEADVRIETVSTWRGTIYRVRAGAWASREEAEAALTRFAARGYADALVASR